MREYSITKNVNELWKCEVTDSYGNTHHNYFKTSDECMEHVIYSWENEDYSHSYDSSLGLALAIKECKELDEKAGRRKIM
jgi:hypothetical protein|tara:strand:+ start:370 stop:609 length:240 start_codon:yes stop_codon:yes gene_type:complete